MDTQQIKVPRDAYFFIDVTWKSGFKHRVPARGYELKSWLNHLEKNEWVEFSIYAEVTQLEYDAFCHPQVKAPVKQPKEPRTKTSTKKPKSTSTKSSSKNSKATTPKKLKKTIDKK